MGFLCIKLQESQLKSLKIVTTITTVYLKLIFLENRLINESIGKKKFEREKEEAELKEQDNEVILENVKIENTEDDFMSQFVTQEHVEVSSL
jgi:hypothetical protein